MMVDDILIHKALSDLKALPGRAGAGGGNSVNNAHPNSRMRTNLVNVCLRSALCCAFVAWPADALPTRFTCAPIQELISKMMDTEARARDEVAVGPKPATNALKFTD
jgi:hypothetical protein